MPASQMPLLAAFTFVMAGMLYLDLWVVNRGSHVVKVREAALWCGIWVGLALLFNLGVWHQLGRAKALEFLTGYIIEESLSVDNLFVFIMIFSYFKVGPELQPRVLKWGILGAVLMRFVFIMLGTALVRQFHWVLYFFGALLIYTGIKLFRGREEGELDPGKNPLLRLFKRAMPFDAYHQGAEFLIRREGRWVGTPLLATLVVVEASDVMFAVDSIPAIFAITTDPFIVYTSNIFAILGLRSVYFMLAHMMGLFSYLNKGISAVLVFVGCKMLLMDVFHIPIGASLATVGGLLGLSIAASRIFPPAQGAASGAKDEPSHA